MKFSRENSKDIQKYFQGTFVKFLGMQGAYLDGSECHDAGELVHSIDQVNGDIIKGKRWENGESTPFQFMLYPEKDAPAPEVEFLLPRKSYFNTPNGALLLFRIPARQYRRGICGDNVSILRLDNGEFDIMPVNHETIAWYIQKPMFLPFELRPISYAVSRRMAVDRVGRIFIDQTKIGSINYAEKEIQAEMLFHSEVKTVLQSHNQWGYTLALPKAMVLGKGKKLVQQATIMDDVE